MSEQVGGLLDTVGSYHFDRNKNSQYRAQSIDAAKFSSWQKDNMYKSSYAHFHSKVFLSSFRNLSNPKIKLFQDMEDIFPVLSLMVSMPKAIHQYPKTVFLVKS